MFLEHVETPITVWTPPLPKVSPKPVKAPELVSFRQKFLAELRSGQWSQCRKIFYTNGGSVCAVTLLFRLVERERPTMTWADGQDANYLLTLPLQQMNDGHKMSFAEIANFIEGLPY
jgi:hypothetical protein